MLYLIQSSYRIGRPRVPRLGSCLRTAVWNLKLAAALVLALLICLPHLNWLVHHRDLALSSVPKLKIVEDSGWWAPARAGLGKLLLVLFAHLGLLTAVLFLFFWRGQQSWVMAGPGPMLLGRMLGWIVCLVTLSMVVFRVTNPRDRYMQPLFVWLPMLLVPVVKPQMTHRRWLTFMGLSAAVAFGMLLVAPGRVLLAEPLHKREVLTWPFGRLARDLQSRAAEADCIIAEDHRLAGNLKLCFPQKLVLDPEVGPLFRPVSGKTLLVWDADQSPAPPRELLLFARAFAGKSLVTGPQTFEEALKFHRHGTFRLGAAVLKERPS